MERLTVGVLGLRRGITHFRNLVSMPNVDLIGAADRLPMFRDKAAALLDANSKCKLVETYDELLAMRPDAIVIASNGKMQVQHTIMALESGCNVLCEVPGAYTVDECYRLRAAVEHSGLFYMFAENTCYANHLRYWRKWITEGRFGHISLIEGEYVHYLPETLVAPDGTRLTPSQASGRLDVQPIWRADQPPIQYLTHDLGPALELLDDRCVSVTCRSGPSWCREAPLRPDGQFALFETAKGTLIRILITLSCKRPHDHNMRIFGTEGGVELYTHENCTRRFQRGMQEREGWQRLRIPAVSPGEDPRTGHGGIDRRMLVSFVNALLEGRPSPIDVYRAIEYTLPGIIAAKSADLSGAPLSIPNLRREPGKSTGFWDAVGLPEDEPEVEAARRPVDALE